MFMSFGEIHWANIAKKAMCMGIIMKFFHIADLHIGKKLQGESLIREQIYMLNTIIKYAEEEKPDALIIAGDVYDKSVPSAEAVLALDDFIDKLVKIGLEVFMISGNHDSGERLYFGKRVFEKQNIHIGSIYQGNLEEFAMKDEFGEVHIYLLPFVKPTMVQPFFTEPVETYEEGVKMALSSQIIDTAKRNILVAHQFVVNIGEHPVTSESEQISLGGLDQVDAGVFGEFDYVALGHIHKPQKVGRQTVRYCGSLLKYSFSEVNHIKSIMCVEMKEKDVLEMRKLPLKQQTDLVILEDNLENLLSSKYEQYRTGYYLSVKVVDNRFVLDPIGQLRNKFEGILEFHIDNTMQKSYKHSHLSVEDLKEKSTYDLFKEFFEKQNGDMMNAAEEETIQKILAEIEQGGKSR